MCSEWQFYLQTEMMFSNSIKATLVAFGLRTGSGRLFQADVPAMAKSKAVLVMGMHFMEGKISAISETMPVKWFMSSLDTLIPFATHWLTYLLTDTPIYLVTYLLKHRHNRHHPVTWRCSYSSSFVTTSPVTRWNLTWRAFFELWLCLNFSTLSACFNQHSSMPRMHFTAHWANSCVRPLSSSILLLQIQINERIVSDASINQS